MTLIEAIAVLNERRHGDTDEWEAENLPGRDVGVRGQYRCEHFLTPFEAFAIAERYLSGTTEEADQQVARSEMGSPGDAEVVRPVPNPKLGEPNCSYVPPAWWPFR